MVPEDVATMAVFNCSGFVFGALSAKVDSGLRQTIIVNRQEGVANTFN